MNAEGADDGVRRNAWSCPAKSPDQPVTSPTTLSLIMQEEKQQDIMLDKATNKPLALLQVISSWLLSVIVLVLSVVVIIINANSIQQFHINLLQLLNFI